MSPTPVFVSHLDVLCSRTVQTDFESRIFFSNRDIGFAVLLHPDFPRMRPQAVPTSECHTNRTVPDRQSSVQLVLDDYSARANPDFASTITAVVGLFERSVLLERIQFLSYVRGNFIHFTRNTKLGPCLLRQCCRESQQERRRRRCLDEFPHAFVADIEAEFH